MEVFEALTNYYSGYDEEGRLLSRHGSVEYLTTMRYIEKYLKPGMRVLEIGAATGRYSHALARKGYQVDAVELVQHNIDIFNGLTQPGEEVSIRQGCDDDTLSIHSSGIDDAASLNDIVIRLLSQCIRIALLPKAGYISVQPSANVINSPHFPRIFSPVRPSSKNAIFS